MQQDWDKAIEFVLRMEGGYSNDPNDSGGETNFGISKRAYPNLDIKNLTVDKAKEIYMNDYWNPCHCDELASEFAIATFDAAVNEGVKPAIRMLQIALDVDVDCIIGSNTVTATFKATPRMVLKLFALRIQHYYRIIVANPSDRVFDLNWAFRVISLEKLVFTGSDQ